MSHGEKERKREQVCDVRWAVLQGRANEAPLATFHWNRSSVKRRRRAPRRVATSYTYITPSHLVSVPATFGTNKKIKSSRWAKEQCRIISQFKTLPSRGLVQYSLKDIYVALSTNIKVGYLKTVIAFAYF